MRFGCGEGAWVEQVGTPSLGDHTYVVAAGGAAAVIDPQRDFDRFAALIPGIPVAAVLETHVHNDYVTGGPALAAAFDSQYVLPADSGATVAHRAVSDGETVVLGGGWTLRPVHTPGHTPHHTAYLLEGRDGPSAAFTGGSMLVGAVGRTDLVDPSLTEALTRSQHRSVRRLAAGLDDPVTVAPTHGEGSFCVASETGETTSTVGAERLRNPALLIDDEDRFVSVQMAGLLLHPGYYSHMAPVNRAGPAPIPGDPLPRVAPDDPAAAGAVVIDLRPADQFAAGHVPGSLNIPLSDSTATYAGWVIAWNTPAILVGRDAGEVGEARLQMARIGYDRLVGAVEDGLSGWKAAGKPLSSYRVARWGDLMRERPPVLLDVRDPKEAAYRIPGAVSIHVSALEPAALPRSEVWVHCVTGYRAAIAASRLDAAGRTPVLVLDELDRYRGPKEPA